MLNRLSIKARLLTVMILLSLLLLGTGLLGLHNLGETNDALRTVYADRVVPLGQLETVFRSMLEDRLDLQGALSADAAGVRRALKRVAERKVRRESEWAAYQLTYLNERERVLVPRFNEQYALYREEAVQPALDALQSGESAKAREIIAKRLESLYEAMQPTMNELMRTQIDESKREYDQSQALYAQFRLGAVVAMALGIALAVAMSVWAITGIRRQLAMALGLAQALTRGTADKLAVVNAIAAGNLDQQLTGTVLPPVDVEQLARDEIGELVRNVLHMSEAQGRLDEAFMHMTVALRDSRESERARDWLKSAQNDLNTLMRGEHASVILAAQVLGRLAELLDAPIGTFYLVDEQAGELELAAGHALPAGFISRPRLGGSEGVLGQALQDDRLRVLNTVEARRDNCDAFCEIKNIR